MNAQLRILFVSEQTALVNELYTTNVFFSDMENMFDEDGDENEVFIWWNVSVYYIDLVEEYCNEQRLPFIKNDYGMWFGQPWYGTSFQNSGYWPSMVEKFPFLN